MRLPPSLVLLVSLPLGAAAQEAPFVEAARARQAAIPTLEVALRHREVRSAGTMGFGQPPQDYQQEVGDRLVLGEPGRALRENAAAIWGTGDARPIAHRMIGASSGPHGRVLFTRPERKTAPMGMILPDPGNPAVKSLQMMPLTLFARGLDPVATGITWDQLRATGRRERVQDRECVELAWSAPNASAVQVWADPAAGFVPVAIRAAGRPTRWEIDIAYAADSSRPREWACREIHEDGRLIQQQTYTVERWAVQATLPAETFELTFPTGTLVSDHRDRVTYRVGEAGELQVYQEPVESNPPLRNSLPTWPLAGAAAFSALAVAWLIRRRRQRRGPRPAA